MMVIVRSGILSVVSRNNKSLRKRDFATYTRPYSKTNTNSIYSSLEKVPYKCAEWMFFRARHQYATTTHSMTDTMGRMHSDAQFAGSSSVKPYGLFLLRTSAEQMDLLCPRFVVSSSTR